MQQKLEGEKKERKKHKKEEKHALIIFAEIQVGLNMQIQNIVFLWVLANALRLAH